MAFDIRFWGVRGTIACPSTSHAKYGGNTSCIQVTVGDRIIIFDAGTGIRDRFVLGCFRNPELFGMDVHHRQVGLLSSASTIAAVAAIAPSVGSLGVEGAVPPAGPAGNPAGLPGCHHPADPSGAHGLCGALCP